MSTRRKDARNRCRIRRTTTTTPARFPGPYQAALALGDEPGEPSEPSEASLHRALAILQDLSATAAARIARPG
jgi:hypothetical protein